jgi:hypothetical protein
MFISAKWGSQKDGRVFIANKRDGSHLTTVEEHVGDVQGVAIYQMRQQSSGQNPCIKASCSDECVASFFAFTDYQCMCPEGVTLLITKEQIPKNNRSIVPAVANTAIVPLEMFSF